MNFGDFLSLEVNNPVTHNDNSGSEIPRWEFEWNKQSFEKVSRKSGLSLIKFEEIFKENGVHIWEILGKDLEYVWGKFLTNFRYECRRKCFK